MAHGNSTNPAPPFSGWGRVGETNTAVLGPRKAEEGVLRDEHVNSGRENVAEEAVEAPIAEEAVETPVASAVDYLDNSIFFLFRLSNELYKICNLYYLRS